MAKTQLFKIRSMMLAGVITLLVELYWKCGKESGLIGGFDWQTKLELLMPVAYWFH